MIVKRRSVPRALYHPSHHRFKWSKPWFASWGLHVLVGVTREEIVQGLGLLYLPLCWPTTWELQVVPYPPWGNGTMAPVMWFWDCIILYEKGSGLPAAGLLPCRSWEHRPSIIRLRSKMKLPKMLMSNCYRSHSVVIRSKHLWFLYFVPETLGCLC